MVLDAVTTRALKNLSRTDDFRQVIAWMDDWRLREIEAMLAATNPVLVHQLQGSCNALTDLLRSFRSVETAPWLVSAKEG